MSMYLGLHLCDNHWPSERICPVKLGLEKSAYVMG